MTNKKDGKGKGGLIALIVVLILIVIGVGVFFTTKSKDTIDSSQSKIEDQKDINEEKEEDKKEPDNVDESVEELLEEEFEVNAKLTGLSQKFTFSSQKYIWFEGDVLLMDYSLFGKSYDEVNKIFGNTLPKTESVDWWSDLKGCNYDWTEYKEKGTNLSDHGINFMFYDDKLTAIGYDTAELPELVDEVEEYFGAPDVDEIAPAWNVTGKVGYDINFYDNGEGAMVSQRYGLWQWEE